MTEEVVIDAANGYVEWRLWATRSGIHLTLAEATRDVVVIHSRGYHVGSRHDRVYVPAQYHVFLIRSREKDGTHRLQHLVSQPVRLRIPGRNGGFPLPWAIVPGSRRSTDKRQQTRLKRRSDA